MVWRRRQKLYEAIWNTNLDKRNFINKIRSMDIVEKLDKKAKSSSRKASHLYPSNAEKYDRKGNGEFVLRY